MKNGFALVFFNIKNENYTILIVFYNKRMKTIIKRKKKLLLDLIMKMQCIEQMLCESIDFYPFLQSIPISITNGIIGELHVYKCKYFLKKLFVFPL